jgi:glycosyltransferase involved in cell wall biosynthesis
MSPVRLAFVGRLEPSAKGQDIMIDVLSRDKWRNRDLQVRFYGSGNFENNLRKLSKRLRPGQIEFKGFVQKVQDIWADNHGLILLSRLEGLPLAIVEAMLCSRMVIVTDVAGNAEYVVPGVNGFVAPAATADFVDHTLEEAWQNREKWQAMGMAALQHISGIVKQNPAEVFAQELQEVLNSNAK